MLDVVGPAAEPGRLHAAVDVSAGGSAVNVARAAARAGAAAAVCGRIGDDAPAASIRSALVAAGVEDRLAIAPGGRTGCVVAVGDRVVADRGANAGWTAAELQLAPTRVVVVSGFVLLHEDTQAVGLAALADAGDALRVVDLGAPGLARRAPLAELLRDADVVVGDTETVAAAGGLDALASGRRAAVRTLAADGAEAIVGEERIRVRAPRTLEASPWGAGDTLVARLSLALADGQPFGDALQAACDAATLRA